MSKSKGISQEAIETIVLEMNSLYEKVSIEPKYNWKSSAYLDCSQFLQILKISIFAK